MLFASAPLPLQGPEDFYWDNILWFTRYWDVQSTIETMYFFIHSFCRMLTTKRIILLCHWRFNLPSFNSLTLCLCALRFKNVVVNKAVISKAHGRAWSIELPPVEAPLTNAF